MGGGGFYLEASRARRERVAVGQHIDDTGGSLLTDGSSAAHPNARAGGQKALAWRSSKADERRVGTSRRVDSLRKGEEKFYDDGEEATVEELMGGRAGVAGAKFVTFKKALLDAHDIREIELAATAPSATRYTPNEAASAYNPRYSIPRAPRNVGLTDVEKKKQKDMEGVGPGYYYPREYSTRASPPSAFFEGYNYAQPAVDAQPSNM